MAIIGQNSLLNAYVPTFYIKNIQDGQCLIYDSVRKAFVNSTNCDCCDDTPANPLRLGELLNVNDDVDNPLFVENGQALVYNSFTSLWENQFIDYNTLLNPPQIPVNDSFSFIGLSDTAKPSLPDGYVRWDSTGTQLIYSTTIPAASITGLAEVAYTGDYEDLINKPFIGDGTVTRVSVVPANGVSGVVSNPTTTPAIALILGDITPTSVVATGPVLGSNLTGVNTGDQTITLVGDVTGSGTGILPTTLATVNTTTGVFGSGLLIPQVTVDGKGRVTHVVNVPLDTTNIGTVKSVSAIGTDGVIATVTDPTVNPIITIGLGDITPDSIITESITTGSIISTGPISGSNFTGSSSGTNTGDQIIVLTGDATNSDTHTGGVLTLATVNPNTGTFGSGINIPQITVDGKGRITGIVNIPVDTTDIGTVKSVSAIGNDGIIATVTDPTVNPIITIDLGDITPTSITVSGPISGSNLSGTNTGDQIIVLTGDATNSDTHTGGVLTLATVNSTPGTFGSGINIPQITVDAKGRILNVVNTPVDSAGFGTVTSVSAQGNDGVDVQVFNPTTTPHIIVDLGDITPNSVTTSGPITGASLTTAGSISGASLNVSGAIVGSELNVDEIVADELVVDKIFAHEIYCSLLDVNGNITASGSITASGDITGANLSGTNTGDQAIVLTGDATNADTRTGGTLTLATVNLTTGLFGSGISVPQITVDGKGRITRVVDIPISTTGIGTVTNVSATGNNGVVVSVTNPTTVPNITVGLGDITPTSIVSSGPISGSNFSGSSSGINTGDQIIVLTGDATNSDTSTGGVLTLATVNATPGAYGDSHFVPTVTVNAKGLVTSVTTQHVDTTVRDQIEELDTVTIAARHQYIVTSELQVDGYIINNGVIAIL